MTTRLHGVPLWGASKLAVAAFLSAACTTAYAQPVDATGDDAQSAIGDITVTATRRAEPISKVPASITAISAQTIKDLDIRGLADYAKLVPNLTWGYGTGGSVGAEGAKTVVIRGISGNNTTNVYIDDTPIPQSVDPRIYFLDHIEVLRGPQGTLFGSSAMGGTIRLITSPPTSDTFNGSVDAQLIGVHHGGVAGVDASGGVNIPIVTDQVKAQVSAIYSYTPGYFERTYNDPAALNLTKAPVAGPATSLDNIGAVRTKGASATLYITPTAIPGLTITPMLIYGHNSANGLPLADYNSDNLVQRRIVNTPEGYGDHSIFSAVTGSYKTPIGRIVSSTSYFHRYFYNVEDGSDGVLNSFYTHYLTYPTGPYPLYPVQSTTTTREKQVTQELRFESAFNGPIQFIGGAFYQEIWRRYMNSIPAIGLATATGGFYTDNDYTSNKKYNTTNLAAYATVNVTPIDHLELSGGLRYSALKYSEQDTATGVYGFAGVRNFKTNAHPLTPRFSAKYDISPTTIIYSTVAQGFRMGGANLPLGAACAGLGLPYQTSDPIEYKSDKLWSYEGGIKSSIGDRLFVSAAAYHIDWSQRQQAVAIRQGLCYTRITVNIGSAVSNGFELESTLKLSSELSVRGSLGYENAHVTDPGVGTSVVAGQPLDSVPHWTGAINADYVRHFGWGKYFLRGSYSYTGSSMSYTQVAAGLRRDAYKIADLRTGISIGRATATVFAKNLFDARPDLSDENPASTIVPPRYRLFVGAPRTVGIELGYNF